MEPYVWNVGKGKKVLQVSVPSSVQYLDFFEKLQGNPVMAIRWLDACCKHDLPFPVKDEILRAVKNSIGQFIHVAEIEGKKCAVIATEIEDFDGISGDVTVIPIDLVLGVRVYNAP